MDGKLKNTKLAEKEKKLEKPVSRKSATKSKEGNQHRKMLLPRVRKCNHSFFAREGAQEYLNAPLGN